MNFRGVVLFEVGEQENLVHHAPGTLHYLR
jgi:hypothetical protein